MQLAFQDESKTMIVVTLEEGETLGNLSGPISALVPVDPGNTDYAAIFERGIVPDPPSPIPTTEGT
jgi:hypothetical protein